MPFIRTSQIEDDIIYLPHEHLSKVRTNRKTRESVSRGSTRTGIFQCLVLVLTIVSMVTCFMVLAIGFFFSELSRFSFYTDQPKISRLIACLDCSDKENIPYHLLDEIYMTHFDGVDQCCAYNDKQFTALLEISMSTRKYVKSALPAFDVNNFSLIPVSAHVQMLSPSTDTVKDNRVEFADDLVTVNLKEDKTNLHHHVRKVELLPDGFKINRSGVYHLYSSIHFHSKASCESLAIKVWHHHIERQSQSQTYKIFITAHTCCNECSQTEETSYAGGSISLLEGDVIQMKVSSYGVAYFDEQSSFAGLMMLGEGIP